MANERENFAISDLDSYIFGGYGGESDNLTSYIYTDRPVYRPEQKVYFKGILRRLGERGYQTPGGAVTVSVEDTNGGKLFEREVTLSSRGTFSGEVDIPEDAPLGTYNVKVLTAEGGSASGIQGGRRRAAAVCAHGFRGQVQHLCALLLRLARHARRSEVLRLPRTLPTLFRRPRRRPH
jgi:uncharacterized protein YfaS (alpha-2-macroglobulin family)